MLNYIILTIVVCIVVGTGIYLATKPKAKPRDIFTDFKIVKRALSEFHKVQNQKCTSLKSVSALLGPDSAKIMQLYTLDEDEKYLMVNEPVSKDTAIALLEKVGGSSYVNSEDKRIYLSLMQFKVSAQEPVAVITYFPKDNISTTTHIDWKSSESKVDDREIVAEEWINKQGRYDEPGNHVVSLRVQDKNGNWSEWTKVSVTVTEEKGIKSIASGANHFFRLHLSGKLDGFGKNKYGQLGDGNLADFDHLKRVVGIENVAQIACGEAHTLFRLYDGRALACGSNDYGQLGNGNRNNSKTAQKIWGLEQVKQIASGPDYSAAILASGAVMTWGNNEFGQLGDSDGSYRELPKRVKEVSRVKQISLSSSHIACVLQDGTVVSWGDNSQGQLGTGFKGKQSEPVVANLTGVFYVAAGKNFTIYVMDNGKVKGVGHNNAGQLGLGNSAESIVLFPKEIPDLKGIVKAIAYDNFVVAMSDIGEVFTWGRYMAKDADAIVNPTRVSNLKYVKDITCSASKGYALLEDGRVARWAGNPELVEYLDEVHHK